MIQAVKVSKSQKEIVVSPHAPKNQQNKKIPPHISVI